MLIFWFSNISNLIENWETSEKLKEINNYRKEGNYEKFKEELNNLSIDNNKFLNEFIQEKKRIDWKYNSDIDTFFFYYSTELTIDNIDLAKQATNNTLKSLEESYNFYMNIEEKVKDLKNKYNYPDYKVQKFLKWFYSEFSPELYSNYINLHKRLAESFLDIINYTKNKLKNKVDLASDEKYIKMINDIQKISEEFNKAVEDIQDFNIDN